MQEMMMQSTRKDHGGLAPIPEEDGQVGDEESKDVDMIDTSSTRVATGNQGAGRRRQ